MTAVGWEHNPHPNPADTIAPAHINPPGPANGDVCNLGIGVNGAKIHYVQLDFINIDQFKCPEVTFNIGSTSHGEGYQVYGSDTAGSLLVGALYSSTYSTACPQQYTYQANPKYRYYSVIAYNNGGNVTPQPSANVLIQSLVLQCGCASAPSASSTSFKYKPSYKPTTYTPSAKPNNGRASSQHAASSGSASGNTPMTFDTLSIIIAVLAAAVSILIVLACLVVTYLRYRNNKKVSKLDMDIDNVYGPA
jgi:hypothetical protein